MITNLKDKLGKMVSGPDNIIEIVTDYYVDLFRTQNPSAMDIELTTDLIPRVVIEDMSRRMNSPFS